jgi:hypothetical protein
LRRRNNSNFPGPVILFSPLAHRRTSPSLTRTHTHTYNFTVTPARRPRQRAPPGLGSPFPPSTTLLLLSAFAGNNCSPSLSFQHSRRRLRHPVHTSFGLSLTRSIHTHIYTHRLFGPPRTRIRIQEPFFFIPPHTHTTTTITPAFPRARCRGWILFRPQIGHPYGVSYFSLSFCIVYFFLYTQFTQIYMRS